MIWFDRTQHTIIVGCRQCGSREVVTSPEAADAWAMAHVYTAHPEPSPEHMRAITAGRVRAHRRENRSP